MSGFQRYLFNNVLRTLMAIVGGLALIALLVWVPFRRSVTGRTVYAIGSAEGAAYMSGLNINRAKIAAFTLGGFFAACGGLSACGESKFQI